MNNLSTDFYFDISKDMRNVIKTGEKLWEFFTSRVKEVRRWQPIWEG